MPLTSGEKSNFFDFLTRLSSLYYLEGKTQAKVAQELGISRQKVQRLLQQARELEIVKINIRTAAIEIQPIAIIQPFQA